MTHRLHASCHCGAVEIEADAIDGPDSQPNRCTCSFCRRRQAANIPAVWASLRVLKGADHLTLYQFGTKSAQHYFCKTCGIYTHHRRRSDPAICGINLGCIGAGEVWAYDPIAWTDGIHHPSDR